MAVYTDISDAELAEFLAAYDLGRARAFKGIAEGIENSNFLLDTDGGRFILTVYERRVSEGDLPFFLGLMSHLAAHGFPCPTPQPDRAGRLLSRVRGKPAALVSFLEGVSVRDPGPELCRAAGAGLAELHLAAQDFPQRRTNDLGHAAWPRLFEPWRALADRLRPGLAAEIAADLKDLTARWPSDLPRGVIHADLFPDNVFFDGPRFVGAIDFYFACNEALAYDLAVCLNAWCFPEPSRFDAARARAMVEGYESRRPLSSAERAALPLLARGAAMRFFLTRLADWEATPAGALVTPKDPLDYEARLAFHRSEDGARAMKDLS